MKPSLSSHPTHMSSYCKPILPQRVREYSGCCKIIVNRALVSVIPTAYYLSAAVSRITSWLTDPNTHLKSTTRVCQIRISSPASARTELASFSHEGFAILSRGAL